MLKTRQTQVKGHADLAHSRALRVRQSNERADREALFEKLFAASPDGIVVVDHHGIILEINPQMESLFGYSCGELLGSAIETLIPQRFRSNHVAHRAAYSHHPSARPMGSGVELCGRRKDGSEFPVDIMLSPVKTAQGTLVLAVVRDIRERKRLEQELRDLALSDPLTGLGNYRRLQEAFETETKWHQRIGRSAALLLLDLNGLKKINDTYGHPVGDRALRRVGEALRIECRAIDTAVRYGGDEFAVVLPDTTAEGACNLARRASARLATTTEVPALSFSYGVAVYPHDGTHLDTLLAFADRTLYKMKQSPR